MEDQRRVRGSRALAPRGSQRAQRIAGGCQRDDLAVAEAGDHHLGRRLDVPAVLEVARLVHRGNELDATGSRPGDVAHALEIGALTCCGHRGTDDESVAGRRRPRVDHHRRSRRQVCGEPSVVGHHGELVGGREHEHAIVVPRFDRLEIGSRCRRLRLDRLASRQPLVHLAWIDVAVASLAIGEQHHDLDGAQIGASAHRTDASSRVGDDRDSAHVHAV